MYIDLFVHQTARNRHQPPIIQNHRTLSCCFSSLILHPCLKSTYLTLYTTSTHWEVRPNQPVLETQTDRQQEHTLEGLAHQHTVVVENWGGHGLYQTALVNSSKSSGSKTDKLNCKCRSRAGLFLCLNDGLKRHHVILHRCCRILSLCCTCCFCSDRGENIAHVYVHIHTSTQASEIQAPSLLFSTYLS